MPTESAVKTTASEVKSAAKATRIATTRADGDDEVVYEPEDGELHARIEMLMSRHPPLDEAAHVARDEDGNEQHGEAEQKRRDREDKGAQLPLEVEVAPHRLAQTPEPLQHVLPLLQSPRRHEHISKHLHSKPPALDLEPTSKAKAARASLQGAGGFVKSKMYWRRGQDSNLQAR